MSPVFLARHRVYIFEIGRGMDKVFLRFGNSLRLHRELAPIFCWDSK